MLKIHTTRFGKVALLCLRGRVVRGETQKLRAAVLAQTDVDAIVLDLARVNTIDAGGLGVMLELRERIASGGIEFRLKNVTGLVSRVLEITKLDTVFDMATEWEALSPMSHTRFAPHLGLPACA